MTDRAYTDNQIQTVKNNLNTAKERFNTLSQSSSRFGELEAYPLGVSLLPCGKVKADEEGMAINTSMRLLLEDAIDILEEYQEVGQVEEDLDPEQDEECEQLFSLIRNLNIEVDYDKIDRKIDECCDDLKDDIKGVDNDLVGISNKITSIDNNVNNISQKNTSISASISNLNSQITTILTAVNQLLNCPCDQNIIGAIQLSLSSLEANIKTSFDKISVDLDSIDVDGAEVNIDYNPIFEKLNDLKVFVDLGNTNINNNINTKTDRIYDELTSCCHTIFDKLNNLDFDLTPVLQAIANSEKRILSAFILSENKVINNIVDAKTTILSGQTEIKNIIVARIDARLNKNYVGAIVVRDREGNEYNFPFSGVGLDGIHNTILSLVQAMEILNNQKGSPCDNVVLIYSDRYPAHVLEDQLEILFIEEGTEWEPSSNKKRVTIHNPREGLDFCRDIYPLAIDRGNAVYGKLEWSYSKPDINGNLRIHESYTGGRFSSETGAISFLEEVAKLSKIPAKPPRVTKNTKYKTVVATQRFRPVRAVLTRFHDDGKTVREKRCLEAPPEGCS
ncbi:MAG: hypothetical protein AAGA60_30950 [Cyanobacteria bacterium P01_E01_bin.42]